MAVIYDNKIPIISLDKNIIIYKSINGLREKELVFRQKDNNGLENTICRIVINNLSSAAGLLSKLTEIVNELLINFHNNRNDNGY